MKVSKTESHIFKATLWMFLLTVINEIALVVVTLRLPDRVATHLNYRMQVDRIGSPWWIPVLGLLPVLLAAGMWIYARATQRNAAVAQNRRVEGIVLPTLIAFFVLVTWLPVLMASRQSVALGDVFAFPIDLYILLPLSALMILLGNFMGVIKQNRWLGIRTPWTLASETVWRRTHRLGGFTGVLGGVVLGVCTVAGHVLRIPILPFVGVGAMVILLAVVPIWYSYRLYKKEKFS